LRRGAKRAVFIDEEVATRFGSDEELEQALRALLQASDHVRKTGGRVSERARLGVVG
jgi:hypothetical protein